MRYYFNIKDGQTVLPDPEGDELPDQAAVLTNIRAERQAAADASRALSTGSTGIVFQCEG
jgi:hypothetical protein